VSVGDLGRRVAERRRELGLTTDEVAERTGMSPTYLRLVESSPSCQISRAALWRLAAGLETSVDALSGSGLQAPPGRSEPSDRPSLEQLTVEECFAMVAPGGVGRFCYADEQGPVAVPVNFGVLDGDIAFRTDSNAMVLAVESAKEVSFEVDHLDEALSEGWSVLLTGEARVVVDADEIDRVRNMGILPWAGGERPTYVRLIPQHVSGRRIRRKADHG